MSYKIFVDGAVGTTGLRIHQRLAQAHDITLLTLPDALRKETDARLEKIHEADLTFLCLPDEASKAIAALAPASAKLCDASTAHRVDPAWVYGFAELHGKREAIAASQRVANPGCHATGFNALIAPLVAEGWLDAEALLHCHSLTGYSGGGNAMINAYEAEARPASYDAPRLYGLGLNHKHLPEMQAVCGLANAPLFNPIVCDFYSGMLTSVTLPRAALKGDGAQLAHFLQAYYQDAALIRVHNYAHAPEDGTLSANALSGFDDLEIFVLGSDSQVQLCARFDNLGKGASGAAIQNMNLMLGREETAGLCLSAH